MSHACFHGLEHDSILAQLIHMHASLLILLLLMPWQVVVALMHDAGSRRLNQQLSGATSLAPYQELPGAQSGLPALRTTLSTLQVLCATHIKQNDLQFAL